VLASKVHRYRSYIFGNGRREGEYADLKREHSCSKAKVKILSRTVRQRGGGGEEAGGAAKFERVVRTDFLGRGPTTRPEPIARVTTKLRVNGKGVVSSRRPQKKKSRTETKGEGKNYRGLKHRRLEKKRAELGTCGQR